MDAWTSILNQFGGRLACHRFADRLLKSLFVASDNSYVLTATGCGDIEEFLLHPVGGDDHGVHRFALAAMGGDGVAVRELLEVAGQGAAIFKIDASSVDSGDGSDFPIGRVKPSFAAISGQQKMITGSDFNGARLHEINTLRLLAGDRAVAIFATYDDAACFHPHDLAAFILANTVRGAMETQELAGAKVFGIGLLGGSPVQRHMPLKNCRVAKLPRLFAFVADGFGIALNLLMGRTHHQWTSSHAPQIRLGDNLRPRVPPNFLDCPECLQLCEAALGIRPQFLDRLSVTLLGLMLNLGQRYSFHAGFPFQYLQRITGFDL